MKNKGITLIALIITIIILLILAGIALASLSGENGLLKRSSQAKEEAVKAQLKEEIEIAIMDIQTGEQSKGNNVTLESLAGKGEKDGQLENQQDMKQGNITANLNGNEITGKYKGYDYKIDEDLNVIIGNGIPVSGSTGGNQGENGNNNGQSQGISGDYRDNLFYEANLNELVNSQNEKVTKVGTIKVDPTNTYATFDGTNGIVVNEELVDPNKKLLGTSTKTFTCWYRTSKDSYPGENFLVSLGPASGPLQGSGIGCGLEIMNNQIDCGVGGDGNGLLLTFETSLDEKWHFLVGVFEEGTTAKLYYDNVRFSKNVNYNTQGSTLSIGWYYEGRPLKFAGDIADVRIYSSALNDDQVYQLYKYGKDRLKNN